MEFIILALPVLSLIWLLFSIIRLCRTNKENTEKRKSLKKQIMISAALIGIWFALIVCFLFLIMYSITVNGM